MFIPVIVTQGRLVQNPLANDTRYRRHRCTEVTQRALQVVAFDGGATVVGELFDPRVQ